MLPDPLSGDWPHDLPQNKPSNIRRLKFYHSIRWNLAYAASTFIGAAHRDARVPLPSLVLAWETAGVPSRGTPVARLIGYRGEVALGGMQESLIR